MRILMYVHHGQNYLREVVRGETFEVCLAYLSQTSLYKGYGPSLSVQMQPLKDSGKLSFGWAEYLLITDEQMEELLKV